MDLDMQKQTPTFDLPAAHGWFSAEHFNRVWSLLDLPKRSPEEEETMISLCHSSLVHWRERPDCGLRQLGIGYWQLSRVYAVLGQAENARHYADLCLSSSTGETPFYLAYAHEAMSRAGFLAGQTDASRHHLAEARRLAGLVEEPEERQFLEQDLADLAGWE